MSLYDFFVLQVKPYTTDTFMHLEPLLVWRAFLYSVIQFRYPWYSGYQCHSLTISPLIVLYFIWFLSQSSLLEHWDSNSYCLATSALWHRSQGNVPGSKETKTSWTTVLFFFMSCKYSIKPGNACILAKTLVTTYNENRLWFKNCTTQILWGRQAFIPSGVRSPINTALYIWSTSRDASLGPP